MDLKKACATKLFGVAIIGLMLQLVACSSIKEKEGCNRFRTGRFAYHFREPQGNFPLTITRSDSIQTESSQFTGITKMTIKWTSDCTYELRLISSSVQLPDSIQKVMKALPLENEIINSTDKYYIFRAKRAHTGFVLIDTIWVGK
ncbi:hypothetical protein [Hymenobacter sp. PAMC 26628]|uniref:hypothetical protein n=1 Tax=Hymenobacter sp. PAMC 26628 TaxID=1484118 RepID=UPI0012FFB53E|nr:hypothetical protein [Hymenobacter sp. PAMC 26628]